MERNFKQEIKEWWDENKRLIKVGVSCAAAGIFIGFIKGIQTNFRLSLLSKIPDVYDSSEDDFVYNESTVDDPELLELIRMEEENS